MAQGKPLKICFKRFRLKPLLLGASLLLLLGSLTLWWSLGDRLRLEAAPPSQLILDREGRFLGEHPGPDGRLGFWLVDSLPQRVIAATLAVEDQRFYSHLGVDPIAILRAIAQNLFYGKRISGASTIAMQVARMQDPAPRTWGNKLLEAVTALRLVQHFGRPVLLAHYLRIAPYGQNIHGVAYAARRYFNKPVDDLSWAESALLAGLPQSPSLYDLSKPKGLRRARARAQRVLIRLHQLKVISEADFGRALAELKHLQPKKRSERPPASLHALFLSELRRSPEPLIHSTLDLPLQTWTQKTLALRVEQMRELGVGNAAALIVDLSDHSVRASVGSVDWYDQKYAGALDFSRTKRSPGSTVKPFIYALALEQGIINPGDPIDDLQRSSDGIGNADGRFLGPLLPRAALANSRNVPVLELSERLGLNRVYDLLERLNLGDLSHAPSYYGPAIALGAQSTRLLDLVQAYTLFPGEGRAYSLRWRLEQESLPGPQIFSQQSARLISLFLSDPMARLPSFSRGGALELPFPTAIKTGTSANYRDAWAIAWTRRFLVAVWVGHPRWQPMKRITGYRAAAPILREILIHLHPSEERTGLADHFLPAPEKMQPVEICALSGKRPTLACEHRLREWFHQPPQERCSVHLRLPVDTLTGALAKMDTPKYRLQMRTFLRLPPRYALWMKQKGLLPPPGLQQAGLKERQPQIKILSPRPGQQILSDPEAPPDFLSIPLRASVNPPVPQLLWYVDGEPFALAEHPYEIRWPITPGSHSFQARLPFSHLGSKVVKIVAR